MSNLTKSPITADSLETAGMSFLDPSDAILQWSGLFTGPLFAQSNLVSDDQPGHLNAQIQDPNLINPWGVAFSPIGPFWVNNNDTGTATIYDVNPMTDVTTASSLVVTIAPPAGTDITAAPTGIVFNSAYRGRHHLRVERRKKDDTRGRQLPQSCAWRWLSAAAGPN